MVGTEFSNKGCERGGEIDFSADKFIRFIEPLNLDFGHTPVEFKYDNPTLILVDAVLSINRHYQNFVVPRVDLIRQSGIETLEEIIFGIDTLGVDEFCNLWHYRHPQRVEILRDLASKFLTVKEDFGINGTLAAMQHWGKQSTVDEFDRFNVRGIGFTTFQYLRIMCGSDTVKPDIHITRAVYQALEKKCNLKSVVEIVETSARRINVSARQLDYALWSYYSQESK